MNNDCCADDLLDECAQKLKVCGHPMRLKLLCRIVMDEHPCVSELWSCLDQPQPVISQHLAVLKQKGIVASQVQGNRRVYTIVDPFVEQMIRSMGAPSASSSRSPREAARTEPPRAESPRISTRKIRLA